MVRLTLHLILLTAFSSPVLAQRLPPGFHRWTPGPAAETDSAETSGARFHPRDYRYEGLIFGGITLGALGAYVGSQIRNSCPLSPGGKCDNHPLAQAVGLGLVGAVLGGGTGYLLGRISPKRPGIIAPDSAPATALPDSVRVRTGYQHWKGAAIGTAAGLVLGGTLLLVDGECSDCNTTTGDRIKGVSAITASSALLGFLAGLASPRYHWVARQDLTSDGADLHRE